MKSISSIPTRQNKVMSYNGTLTAYVLGKRKELEASIMHLYEHDFFTRHNFTCYLWLHGKFSKFELQLAELSLYKLGNKNYIYILPTSRDFKFVSTYCIMCITSVGN